MAKTTKKEVYFITTKYRNEPAKVSFYTKNGRFISFDSVEKRPTKAGVRFYAKV